MIVFFFSLKFHLFKKSRLFYLSFLFVCHFDLHLIRDMIQVEISLKLQPFNNMILRI